jgi:hypothetical protein
MLGGHSFDGYAVIDAEHRETQMYSGFEHIKGGLGCLDGEQGVYKWETAFGLESCRSLFLR